MSMILKLNIPFIPAKAFQAMWNMIQDNTQQYNDWEELNRENWPDQENEYEHTTRWKDGEVKKDSEGNDIYFSF